jgi:hypothetical protein
MILPVSLFPEHVVIKIILVNTLSNIYKSALCFFQPRMNQSCCYILQYNTEALVLVLQYYFGKGAILKQYQINLSVQSACTAHAGISDRVKKKIEIRRVSN